MPKPFRCRVGIHAWDNDPLAYGSIRTCTACGVRDRLEEDESGWNTSVWVRIRDDKTK